MILNDRALWMAAQKGLVKPFHEENIQGSSIDLTLGNHLKIEREVPLGNLWSDHDMDNGDYCLRPQEFVLAHTAETVTIPDDCCAMLLLRSSAARAGFEHSFSGWIDPGFTGQLTLELRNNLRHRALWLEPGLRLCQLVVHRLVEDAQQTYGQRGNYQGQIGATASTNYFSRIAA